MNKFAAISLFAAGLLAIGNTFVLAIEKPRPAPIERLGTTTVETPTVVVLDEMVITPDAPVVKKTRKTVRTLKKSRKPVVRLDKAADFCYDHNMLQGRVGEKVLVCERI